MLFIYIHTHFFVKSTRTIASKWRPKFPTRLVKKTSSLLFGVKWTLPHHQIHRNNAEIFQDFAEVIGLEAFRNR